MSMARRQFIPANYVAEGGATVQNRKGVNSVNFKDIAKELNRQA